MSREIYDTIIIGGGPAGVAAAVYAGRKKMKTLLITKEFGGQSLVSNNIENWVGEISLTGQDLAKKLEKHLRTLEKVEIRTSEKVAAVEIKSDCLLEVRTDQEDIFRSKTVIVASGGRRRRLQVPGEDRLQGQGVAFCSTCDAPFFQDKDVAVVGSGNTALETVLDLKPYARQIFLFIRGPRVKGDPVIQEKITGLAKLQILTEVEILEILGEEQVTGLRYREIKTGEEQTLKVNGVFIAIGTVPNSDIVRHLVDTNQSGEILVDHKTTKTSRWGIFAAGDVTDDPFKQNNISAGDGVRAALSAYHYILDIQKFSPCMLEPED